MFNQCPDPGHLQAYVDKELNDMERKLVAKHLQVCPQCNALAANIEEENHWLSNWFAQENMLLEKFQHPTVYNSRISFWLLCLGVAAAMLGSRFLLFPWLTIDGSSWLVPLAIKQVGINGWNLLVAALVSLTANFGLIKQALVVMALGGIMLSLIPIYVLRKNISWEDNVVGS